MAEQEEISGPTESLANSETLNEPGPPSPVHVKTPRLFGHDKAVHKVLGGGKPADVFLWRNKKISALLFGVVSAVWVLFELLDYHLLTLVCHVVILALSSFFLWSNVTTLINKKPPRIPDICLPEEPFAETASALRVEINRALVVFKEIASGKDLKKYLLVVFCLWGLSVAGSLCSFLTLFYIVFVVLHTVPVLFEKYNDKIAEKAKLEMKRGYILLDRNVLGKLPRDKKRA